MLTLSASLTAAMTALKRDAVIGKQSFKPENFPLQNCDLSVPIIRNKLKIFYSIIISNVIFMVDDFPRMKVTPQVFCHNKAMFKNISIFISHREKEIIRVYHNRNVTISQFSSTTFPVPRFLTDKKTTSLYKSLHSLWKFLTTSATNRVSRLSSKYSNP